MNNRIKDARTGIALVVGGLFVAAYTGVLMKVLAESLPAVQIVWFRFMGFFLIMVPIVLVKVGREVLKPKRLSLQLVRGLTISSATVCFVTGVKTVDYADSIAILYAYPFLLSLLAVWFLGERIKLVGWIGVLGGFIGVLLVIRPSFNDINTGAIFIFACAVIVSVQMAMNRKLGSFSHPLTTSVWGAFVAALTLSMALPFVWQPISTNQLGLLCLIAVTGSVNQICLVFAFAKAEASLLAPFTYLEIVAAVMFGLIYFGTLPDWISWSGIALIIACGLLVGMTKKSAVI